MRYELYKLIDELKKDSDKRGKYINLFLTAAALAASFITLLNIGKIYTSDYASDSYTVTGQPTPLPEAAANLKDNYRYFLSYRDSAATARETLLFSPVLSGEMSTDAAPDAAIPDIPPSVQIKALIMQDNKFVCTLDIAGEAEGGIYKIGTIFGNGCGKILSIDTKGVTWLWRGKRYRTDL